MIVPLGHVHTSERQIELVMQALRNNRTSSGPFTAQFESLIGDIHGVAHAIFMASGTCGLLVALEAAKEVRGWPDGAEVIVPATTFIATVAAVRQAGLTPVLCDVRPDDANIDVSKVGGSITKNTVAVLPVHLLGRACQMWELQSLCEDHGLDIIEDCCEAVGVTYGGKPIGSFGIAGAISTYVCHHVSTGVGGAVLTNSAELATICRSLMVHGRDPSYLKLEDDDGLDDAALSGMMRARYSFVRWGHSFRATEMEAALGIGALEDVPISESRRQRNEVAYALDCELTDKWPEYLERQKWPDGSNPLFYPVVCKDGATCRGLSHAFELDGIETRPLMPLLMQPTIRAMLAAQGVSPFKYRVACDLLARAFLIGCHPGIQSEHVEHIRETAAAYFAGQST